ncbi:MAG: BamA/TamA family outer membrane protein [Magnetococcales bacterium]|nr:BamA/TamA family outer membrane protein [Magnetococcales bacterium]
MNSNANLRIRRPSAWQGIILTAFCVPTVTAVVQAAVPPDESANGSREVMDHRSSPPRKTVIRAASSLPKAESSMTSLKLSIKEFRFDGVSQVSADAIDEVLAPWKDRELRFPEFELAVHAVANYLRQHGHPDAEVKLSRALVGGGTVMVAIQGLSDAPTALAMRPSGEETVPRIEVKEFKVSGATLAAKEEFDQLLAASTGKALTMKEIEQAAESVANHLRAKGYPLVQAYLPPQRIDGGVVEIAVQEGVIDSSGGMQVAGGGERVKREVVEEILAKGVTPGEPLRIADLERAVLLANDTPGIQSVKTTLTPGSQPGTTQVEAKVEESSLVTGTVWADNYGSRYTGRERVNAQLNLNSPFGHGEQLSLNAAKSSGMESSKVAVQAPIGSDGLKMGASYSQMKLDIGEEVTPLNLSSNTAVASAYVSYPLERSSTRNTWVTANYDAKHVTNDLSGARNNDRKIDLLTVGANGNLVDPLQGQVSWGASVAGGDLDLSGKQSYQALDASSARTEGDFAKLNWNLQRTANITEELSWLVVGSGMFASKNLDSSEKFQLGGPTGVRAYPVGEGLGDSGWLASAEVRYKLGQTPIGEPQIFSFYDYGHVTQYHSLWSHALTAGQSNSYSLSGWGAGASLVNGNHENLRVMWAQKIGSNPNPTSSGADSDGTNKSGRIWIVGNILF